MKRLYESVIKQHFHHHQQLLFLAGPRQVGKTTISLTAEQLTDRFVYLNWDNQDHRKILIQGPSKVASFLQLDRVFSKKPLVVFDELHKYRHWKIFLKGFFDTYKDKVHIIVTGSSKLDIYRTGGDSLMGRYFPYRIHPLSVAECLWSEIKSINNCINSPSAIEDHIFQNLLEFGGFPEPFLKQDQRFATRWKRLRKEQLFREDIRTLSRIQEIHQLEILADLLKQQTGQLTNYSNLSNKINVSITTITRWLDTLTTFYFCFKVKPWSKNITRSLLKEPKIYLWDWAEVTEEGARNENFIASHLLKAVHFWTDQGLGDFDLYFLRDKEKRQVDFLVTKNDDPWFLVEVKSSADTSLSPHLKIFQEQTKANHAFQVVINMEYVEVDCFSFTEPVIVPAKTFLSQLV